ncbi:hypothetical protein FIBSPDRAFT_884978 [Athelia psychrophila]|uniref:Uncharacterized protein n=1 Tax=Athelia psychrophila TaxID=1759441 RepID=A0A166SLS2_9AGAM|nr:hypothetical protein FIBSPDRAFT_884978 [Fibularhizoctonia sp. CBS 109695]
MTPCPFAIVPVQLPAGGGRCLADPGYFKQGVKGAVIKGCASVQVPESLVTACKPGDIHLRPPKHRKSIRTAEVPLRVCLPPAPPPPPGRRHSAQPLARSAHANRLKYLREGPECADDALVEENVRGQVANLSKAPAVQDAWKGGKTMW